MEIINGVHIEVEGSYLKERSAADSDIAAGGVGSAGAGNQYVELNIGGTTYKVLHDGTV
jgi:hypothetical protein